jgi:dTDP-4-dehydrorhamnose 3,5-epimerase-like enzyme
MSDLLIDVSKTVPEVVWTIHRVNGDARGSLTEAFRTSDARELRGFHVAQVNISVNDARVIRGMHMHRHQFDYWYVADGFMQVCVSKGAEHDSRILSPGHGVIIPPTTYHGFLTFTPAILVYGVSREFDHDDPDEHGYHPYTGDLSWALPLESVTISGRDETAPPFSSFT